MTRTLAWTGIALLAVGCASGEVLDDAPGGGATGGGGSAGVGGGVAGQSGATSGGSAGVATGGGAGTPSGGSAGQGGTGGTAAGGTGGIPTGGTGGTATGGTGGSCGTGLKSCGGLCVPANPGVGCSLTDCTPCPPITNANLKCTGTQCDFDCTAGFIKSGNSCVPQGGTGGTGGTSGTGGTGGGTGCATPCDFSEGSNQFLCIVACTISTGNPGLCAPNNCCICA